MLQQSVRSAAMIVQLLAGEAMPPWKCLPGLHLLLVSSPLLPEKAGTRCPAGQYMAFRAALSMTMARSMVERPHNAYLHLLESIPATCDASSSAQRISLLGFCQAVAKLAAKTSLTRA